MPTHMVDMDEKRRNLLDFLEMVGGGQDLAGTFLTLDASVQAKLVGLDTHEAIDYLNGILDVKTKDEFLQTLPTAARTKLENLAPADRSLAIEKLMHKGESSSRKTARATGKMIARNHVPEQQDLFASYPHNLARQSLFHIGRTSELKEREPIKDMVMGSGSWGQIQYSGDKLFISDERIFIVIAAIIRQQVEQSRPEPFTYEGSIRSLLRAAGMHESGQYSAALIKSIKAMHSGRFYLLGKVQGKKTKIHHGYSLISSYQISEETGMLRIVVDADFFETFIREFGLFSNISAPTFCSLPPVAAAIYRFFSAHTSRPDGAKAFKMLTLARAINMVVAEDYPDGDDMTEWPSSARKRDCKREMKDAIKKLIEKKVYGPKSGIISQRRGVDDMVLVYEIERKQIAR